MARKARVEFEGAIYHVMDRDDRREPIFGDDADRERFLLTLGVNRSVNGFVLSCRFFALRATLTNLVSTNATVYFRDSAATNFNQRFYRAVVRRV